MILGERPMQCPECGSTNIRKNGHRRGKQNHICADCQRQFIEDYQLHLGYPDEFKRECLQMYANGMGFRGIERIKGVHHTTVISWVKAVGKHLPDAYDPYQISQVGELDKLETFVGSKKQDLVVDGGRPLLQRYLRLGVERRPQCRNLQAPVGDRGHLEVLFLRHCSRSVAEGIRLVGLSRVYSRGRPDC